MRQIGCENSFCSSRQKGTFRDMTCARMTGNTRGRRQTDQYGRCELTDEPPDDYEAVAWHEAGSLGRCAGLTQFPNKLVSLFEPHTEVIRKGKSGKPNEFGKLVELQEAENQIITHYQVYQERPSDRQLLLPAVEAHRRKLGRVPGWVAADASFLLAGQ